jgi:hypothetical protein
MSSLKRRSALVLAVLLCAVPAFAQPPVVVTTSNASPTGGLATVDIPAPSGATTGDLLVVCAAGVLAADAGDMSASGWTHVATHQLTTTNKIGMLWKLWNSGDGATYTITLGAGTFTTRRGLILRISGANTTTPSDATPSESNASSTARTYLSITSATANSLAVGCLMWSPNDTTYTPEASLTNVVLVPRLAADYKNLVSAGATGNLSGTGTNTTWNSIFWAVKAGTVTPPTTSVRKLTILGVGPSW